MENVFSLESTPNQNTKFDVMPFTIDEISKVLKSMRKGRCTDKLGIALEMFLFGGTCVREHLVETLNAVLSSNEIPTHWCDTFFLLLHKGGMADDLNNWRPIAILSITYKIFARAIYYRVRDQLEYHQSEDQHGFRRLKSTIQALFVVESMISNSFEFQFPLWLVSIDLKKAFDRVDHIVLFTALESQGLDIQYINLLRSLYLKQEGCVDTFRFGIKRGVRQGDVLSPLLFNAVLEFAMRKWNAKLVGGSGFALHPNEECERLTNIRYVDDIIMFAKTIDEAQHSGRLNITKVTTQRLNIFTNWYALLRKKTDKNLWMVNCLRVVGKQSDDYGQRHRKNMRVSGIWKAS